nr:CinA family protein [Oscillospiraceae bacterium]
LCGPDSDGSETPVGTVYVALADASGTQCRRLFFPGDRGRCRALAAHNAFDMIIKTLS